MHVPPKACKSRPCKGAATRPQRHCFVPGFHRLCRGTALRVNRSSRRCSKGHDGSCTAEAAAMASRQDFRKVFVGGLVRFPLRTFCVTIAICRYEASESLSPATRIADPPLELCVRQLLAPISSCLALCGSAAATCDVHRPVGTFARAATQAPIAMGQTFGACTQAARAKVGLLL